LANISTESFSYWRRCSGVSVSSDSNLMKAFEQTPYAFIEHAARPENVTTITTNSNSNRSNSPHHCRAREIQSYSPGGTHMYPYLTHDSLGPCECVSIGSAVFARSHPCDQHRDTQNVKKCRNSLLALATWTNNKGK